MPRSIRPSIACTAMTLLLAASPLLAQTVYTWKDAKGVTHYSDTPPPAREQKKVQVKSFTAGGGSIDVPYA